MTVKRARSAKDKVESAPTSPATLSSVYASQSYRDAIKDRLKYLRADRASLTLKRLAEKIDVQYTYLSRCLNADSSHLSEDHVYALGRNLDLLPEEIDFVLLLRSWETARDEHRKAVLFARIDQIRKIRIGSADAKTFDPLQFESEVAYLFSPLAIIVHVALFIKDFQKNPRALCPLLGIGPEKLKELLLILNKSDYVVLADSDPFTVTEVKSKYPHFTRNHPLMRAHQATMKTLLQSRLGQTAEPEKESFIVTFTMDDAGFARVRDEFKSLVSRIQQISCEGKHQHVYQLNFDFLKWL